jgi:hypothetical protein
MLAFIPKEHLNKEKAKALYCYYILRLPAKRYKELLAIRLGKPFINKNPKHTSFALFLCSPLLIYNS